MAIAAKAEAQAASWATADGIITAFLRSCHGHRDPGSEVRAWHGLGRRKKAARYAGLLNAGFDILVSELHEERRLMRFTADKAEEITGSKAIKRWRRKHGPGERLNPETPNGVLPLGRFWAAFQGRLSREGRPFLGKAL